MLTTSVANMTQGKGKSRFLRFAAEWKCGWGKRCLFRLRTENFNQQQTGADDDAAVGDVEVGPVVVDDVDFEEVDDVGEAEAVVEVSGGSPENECQRDSG